MEAQSLRLILSACATVIFLSSMVSSVAVMSVDLGSEWMKVGIVSPGVPMEIALNKESKRKTPAVVTFRDNTRTFGEDAQTMGIRFPKNSYTYLLDLLGKDFNNPMVKLFRSRFPYYDMEEDPIRGTVLFVQDNGMKYSVEELVSQLFYKAKEYAEQSAGQQIKECVLTVPGYFNQVERKSLLQAAQLADLKVLQLINDYTAVALNYGIFRRKDFNDTANYILFYDMGATKTVATVIAYQLIKTKERGFVEINPQSTVLGVGYDRTLGGLELQVRLRDYLAKKFNELKLTPNDVTKNPRSMAKLFKEAGRVKNILSANNDHYAQVENLLDDTDFRMQVTREQFEELCSDVFERVGRPVNQALEMAGLTMDVITQVVLVGAGTRVPKVQDNLHALVKMELSKNLNTDEAATMGAVYKAADLSAGFKVKKFITKDGVLFPIQVVFERPSSDGTIRQVRRTLFGLMNPYPQKKIITFNKHTDDFHFNVNYAELEHLPASEIAVIGGLNISQINLQGVAAVVKKNQGANIESKGIKAHFLMDDSGLLELANVELVVEKTYSNADDEGTFSKLGNTISKLFKSGDEPAPPPTEEDKQPSENGSKPEDQSGDPDTANKINKTETAKNGSKPEESMDEKPKVTLIKEKIDTEDKILTLNPLNDEQMEASRQKLESLNIVDRDRVARETALNNLESFVIDAQNKLYSEEYLAASTDAEVEKIKSVCTETSDWLYEDGAEADADTYNKKLNEVRKLTHDLYSRVYEHNERPEALKALKQMLNGSEGFLASAKNLTKGNSERDVFTDVEIQNLEKVIVETREWRDTMIIAQDKLKKSDAIVLTVRSLSEKMALLDREVKYLVNKLKIWRPKVPKEKPVPDSGDSSEKPAEDTVEPEAKEETVSEKPVEGDNEETVPQSDKPDVPADDDEFDEHSEL